MKSLSGTSIQFLKGVGPHRKKIFERLGVSTIEDLLYFFPRRYEDRRQITPIAQTKVGEWQTVTGKVTLQENRRTWFSKKHLTEVLLDDKSGRMTLVWFNQPYLNSYFKDGKKVVCHGKVDVYKGRLQMISPEYEMLGTEEDELLSLGRIVPIYPLTRGISQRYLRKTINQCLDKYLDDVIDELPVYLRNQYRLYNLKRSISNIHFPSEMADHEEAIRRISFEEFFFFQVSVMQRRLSVTQKPGIAHTLKDEEALSFINSFPFALTKAQTKVIREIREDMNKKTPMLRLLQGDVGSGKTVVACFGAFTAFKNGFQSCLMAPTEVLARQHYETISKMTEGPLKGMKVGLLVNQLKDAEKEEIKKDLATGKLDFVIGTHALIAEGVTFKNLSFTVIDEQHKFGVNQRGLLSKKGANPDILIMTATPIPRTLCLTLYADMDVSIIDEMPPGRGKIKTLLFNGEQSSEVYELIRQKIKEGEQAYVVYPIIEESEKLDLKAAHVMYKDFQKNVFKEFKVGLLHGQTKKEDAQKVMEGFKNRTIQILVATTVVEVGVDIPNANVMVIEHADRFGLASLHQLRGRIGRGEKNAICILVADPITQEAQLRLKAILSTQDGFKIAQEDLMIRGPGQFFGRHQHGLNELKIANPVTQLEVLELTRKEASKLSQEDPHLIKYNNIRNIIKKRYPNYLAHVSAG